MVFAEQPEPKLRVPKVVVGLLVNPIHERDTNYGFPAGLQQPRHLAPQIVGIGQVLKHIREKDCVEVLSRQRQWLHEIRLKVQVNAWVLARCPINAGHLTNQPLVDAEEGRLAAAEVQQVPTCVLAQEAHVRRTTTIGRQAGRDAQLRRVARAAPPSMSILELAWGPCSLMKHAGW